METPDREQMPNREGTLGAQPSDPDLELNTAANASVTLPLPPSPHPKLPVMLQCGKFHFLGKWDWDKKGGG